MGAPASDWLREFRFLIWTAELNLTKLDRKQDLNILYQVCVFGLLEIHVKMAVSATKLAETFLTSAQKPLNGIQRNLTESNISKFTTKFVFFGPIRKPRWPPRPLIGQDIFDFSSETAEWNSMKLDRKHDLNVLYQVGVFWADRKTKMATKATQSTRVAHCTQVEIQDRHPNFDWLRHFRIWNHWMQFNET